MQRDLLPNTYRDINELSSSQPNIEPMDIENDFQRSIIHPDDNDHVLVTRIDTVRRNQMTNKPSHRSIVQQIDDNNDRITSEPLEAPLNNENTLSQATGFNPNNIVPVNDDEAFALELQQQEYNRDSLIRIPHPYERFYLPRGDGTRVANPRANPDSEDVPHFNTDEELAAHLQAQEDHRRQRFYRQPYPFYQVPPWLPPAPTTENDTQSQQNDVVFPTGPRFQPPTNDDDDDDEEYQALPMNHGYPFFQIFGNPHVARDVNPSFVFAPRRNYRRTGNLQDTEDDFGPEDYERLLRLDDSVRKKKLSPQQINSIKEITFRSNANNTDEENKCGVCLELFEENQTLRRFPCTHVYHKPCADRWLRENNVCPICRKPPVDVQSSSSSSSNSRQHHHRPSNNYNSRRPAAANRTSTNRNNSTNNSTTTNNQHHNSRHGPHPPVQRPS